MLLDAKTRAVLLDAGKNMASQSPSRRLHAKMEATVAIAEGIAKEAKDEAGRERAELWARRGRNLSRKLDVPCRDAALLGGTVLQSESNSQHSRNRWRSS